MDFTYIVRAMLRRKWIIITCVLISVICAIFFTRNAKKGYKSVAQFSTGLTVTASPDPSKGVNFMQSELEFNNVIENINSPKVISLVSYHLLLHDLQSTPSFTQLTEDRRKNIQIDKKKAIPILSAHLDSLTPLSSSDPEEKKVLHLLGLYEYNNENITNKLTVARYQKSDYINIEFKSANPYLSAFVVNTVYNEFKRFHGSNERQRTSLSITGLDSLVQQKRAILDQKLHAKEAFLAATGLLDPSMEGSSKLSQISTFESQLIEERGVVRNQSYRVQELDQLIKTAQSQGLTSISSPNLSKNISIANSEYIRLRKQYNTLNEEYIKKGSKDPELKKQMDKISQDMTQLNTSENNASPENDNSNVVTLDQLVQKKIDAQAQLAASNQKISAIEAKLGQLKGGLNGMAASSATLAQYESEIQLASSEYTAAKDQLNLATNFTETKPENFKQTLIGQPALKPEPSKRLMIIILAGISAFFLSSLVIIFKEFLDNSIKTPSQFQRLTNLPLLGTINKIRFNKNVLETVSTFDEQEKSRDNTFLELLRKLRYEVENSNKKVFLFTSTEPQQGKTMLIQALSYILSLGKKKVLIIDTNFCNNDLTVAINAKPVLEKFELNGKPFDKEYLKNLVTPTTVAGIDIIGCEGGDYTPSEILPRNHLLNYLGKIQEQEYDYIFLEGAPLNEFTDTKELLPYVDGLIAVFSAEKDFNAADKESIKFLEQNKNKFLGAILNKISDDNLEL